MVTEPYILAIKGEPKSTTVVIPLLTTRGALKLEPFLKYKVTVFSVLKVPELETVPPGYKSKVPELYVKTIPLLIVKTAEASTESWFAVTSAVTVTTSGLRTVIGPLVSEGVDVAGSQVKLSRDISHVEVEFQSPEELLLKYSLAEKIKFGAKKKIAK